MVFKAKEVERVLEKKGFERERGQKDHNRFVLLIDGKITSIRTKTSHNGQDIDDYLQKRMAEQMHLTKPEFKSFVSCTISKDEYAKKVVERLKD